MRWRKFLRISIVVAGLSLCMLACDNRVEPNIPPTVEAEATVVPVPEANFSVGVEGIKLSVNIPEGWVVDAELGQENLQGPGDMLIYATTNEDEVQHVRLQIYRTLTAGDKSIDVLATQFADSLSDSDLVDLLDNVETEFWGHTGYYMRYNSRVSGTDVVVNQIIHLNNDWLWVYQCDYAGVAEKEEVVKEVDATDDVATATDASATTTVTTTDVVEIATPKQICNTIFQSITLK